jgi:oligogalacturonide transport system permease protein
MKTKKNYGALFTALRYIILIGLSYVMIYPLLWMIFASFKTNAEIFGNTRLLPSSYSFESFVNGWYSIGQNTYTTFFLNTFKIVIPVVAFTIISCNFIAYGFARFDFFGKKYLFALMLATLMLPNSVVIIPRYLLFQNFGWVNTYLPLIVPSLFGGSFFIFMMVQFIRTLPKELDEAAWIDGCGPAGILLRILLPLCKPAIFSAVVFQFIWSWSDFLNPLIFINTVSKYPLSIALKLTIDPQSNIPWSEVMAMSLLSIIPCIIVYFAAQKYFVEGIATSGLKG